MKIENYPSVVNMDAHFKKYDEKSSSKSISSTGDRKSSENVQLSSRAKEIVLIQKVLETTQDIRTKKIDDIKQRIEHGSYRVRPEDVAKKMIRESLIDLII